MIALEQIDALIAETERWHALLVQSGSKTSCPGVYLVRLDALREARKIIAKEQEHA